MISIVRKIVKYIRFYGGSYRCIVCGKPLRNYFKFSNDIEYNAKKNGFMYDFRQVETLNYEKCNCPFSLSSDRERLFAIFLEKCLQKIPGKISILDFAPSQPFAKRIKKLSNTEYTSADYYRTDVDLQLDACDMNTVHDSTYNIVIFSHVLEHVAKPMAALKEIYRVLKSRGTAIIMVPLFKDVKETQEDSNHQSEELRWKYYGQGDHVRLYAKKDFIRQITSAGFEIEELSAANLDPELIQQNAIADDSILYLCRKPQ
jgi:predicted SAM-dependent methyltransferase